MLEQRNEAVACQVARGLMSGREQKEDSCDEFVFGKSSATLLGRYQCAQQVIGWRRAPLHNQRPDVFHEFAGGPIRIFQPCRLDRRRQRSRDRLSPRREAWTVRLGHAEHLADDQ
jgi:hypothetical protein